MVITGKKSSEAFKNIREVSEELDVPQHVLRFWESKFSEIRPLKRGGRRRYYRPEDLSLLKTIRDLLYVQGYKIRGVQRLLREGKVTTVDSVVRVPPVEELAAEGLGPDSIDFNVEAADSDLTDEAGVGSFSDFSPAAETLPSTTDFEQIVVAEIDVEKLGVVQNRLMGARTQLLRALQESGRLYVS